MRMERAGSVSDGFCETGPSLTLPARCRYFAKVQTLLMLLALAGCQGPGMPPDPLFANRKPVETKAVAGPPVDTPLYEPRPPAQRFFVDRR